MGHNQMHLFLNPIHSSEFKHMFPSGALFLFHQLHLNEMYILCPEGQVTQCSGLRCGSFPITTLSRVHHWIYMGFLETLGYKWNGTRTSQVVLVGKNPPANAGRPEGRGFHPWVGKTPPPTPPRRRARQPTPAFLSGESHGQRSLAGCSP